MIPTLRPGEFVLVNATGDPAPNSLVVVRHPSHGVLLVKRVTGVNSDGQIMVGSDNPNEGIDSRDFGPLHRSTIMGVVTLSLEEPFKRLLGSDPAVLES